MTTMFDTATGWAALPTPDPPAVAGYIDGDPNLRSFATLAARFPAAYHVPIATQSGTRGGKAGDLENGDMTPDTLVNWVTAARAPDGWEPDPWGYCNYSTWSSARQAFHDRGEPEPKWWVADWDGDPNIPQSWVDAGVVAKQYQHPPASGGNFDLSTVLQSALGPYVPPPPSEEDMPGFLTEPDAVTGTVWLCHPSGVRTGVPGPVYEDPAAMQELVDTGVIASLELRPIGPTVIGTGWAAVAPYNPPAKPNAVAASPVMAAPAPASSAAAAVAPSQPAPAAAANPTGVTETTAATKPVPSINDTATISGEGSTGSGPSSSEPAAADPSSTPEEPAQ